MGELDPQTFYWDGTNFISVTPDPQHPSPAYVLVAAVIRVMTRGEHNAKAMTLPPGYNLEALEKLKLLVGQNQRPIKIQPHRAREIVQIARLLLDKFRAHLMHREVRLIEELIGVISQ